jgi:hypothetical protein
MNVRTFALGGAIAVIATAVSVVAPSAGVGSTTPSERVTTTVQPFPTSGTVPVVPESSVRSSGASADAQQEKTHDDSANAPYGDAQRVRAEARIIAENAARLQSRGTSTLTITAAKKPKPKITYIKGYSYCGSTVKAAQRCIDQGKLTLYYPSGVKTLAGHNYKGWYWIDDLPTGRIVKIQSGGLKGTYKVYGHAKVYNKKFPKSGLGASVALQTCEGSGIGFSFLRRV